MSQISKSWTFLIIASQGAILLLLLIPWVVKMFKEIFKKTKYSKLGESSKIRLIRQLDEAVLYLSKNKIGAIITIVNKDNLDNLRTDGILIKASISSALIISIFNKGSQLHDGAIIVDNNTITYAGTYYKITSKSIKNRYGARHRAALGISEQSDSLTIVVSEETGRIIFAKNGAITSVKSNAFQERILEYLK